MAKSRRQVSIFAIRLMNWTALAAGITVQDGATNSFSPEWRIPRRKFYRVLGY
jgi:hypothetical protein